MLLHCYYSAAIVDVLFLMVLFSEVRLENEHRFTKTKDFTDSSSYLINKSKNDVQKDSYDKIDVILSVVLVFIVIGILCYFTG